MKSKLLVLALSMFAMAFVAANGTVDAKTSVLATSATVEINADKEVAVADKEVAAEEIAKAEAAKAKKAEETKTQDQNSCKSCK